MLRPILVLLLLAGVAPAWGQGAPQRIPPPDSEAYCRVLLQRLAAAPAGSHAETVAQLTLEGETLCASGYSRRGIAKLRRALRIALQDAGG